MSLNLVRKNTSSPFHLERSIVPQEEGAYARGGYNPDALYNNDSANAAVEGLGTIVGAALTARGQSEDEKEKEKDKPGLSDARKEELKGKANKIINNSFDPLGVNEINPSKWKK